MMRKQEVRGSRREGEKERTARGEKRERNEEIPGDVGIKYGVK